MWTFLSQALEDRAWEVSMLIVDYWVDAKDVMAHAIADLRERPWLLEVMKQHAMGISQRCLYSSEEQSWGRVDSEEMTVNKYRASAQEALGAIVSFYSDAKATEQLLAVFAPLAQGSAYAQELFLFAMRAFLPTLMETSHRQYLQQVKVISGYSVRFEPFELHSSDERGGFAAKRLQFLSFLSRRTAASSLGVPLHPRHRAEPALLSGVSGCGKPAKCVF